MLKQNHKTRQRFNDSNDSTVTLHDIEILAYQIHEQKGGSELENWLEAERMIKEKLYSSVH
jgi:hypothetical protein